MAEVQRIDHIQSFLHGKTITVLAGEQKQHLVIHETAFSSSESPSLRVLVSESFKEKDVKIIDWSHTELPTVERFLSYLYLGDYNVPLPELRVISQFLPSAGLQIQGTKGSGLGAEPSRDVDNTERSLEETLHLSVTGPLTPIEEYLDKPTEKNEIMAGVWSASEYPYTRFSYLEPLLAHTKLYIFAAYHLCPALQSLTLQRFIKTLNLINFGGDLSTNDMSVLASYIYENTSSEGENPLRKTVSTFVAQNYNQLSQLDLEDLFCQGGDFTRDVIGKVLGKMNSLQGNEQIWVNRRSDDCEDEMSYCKRCNRIIGKRNCWGR